MRILGFAFTQLHILNLINIKKSCFGGDEMDLILFSPSASHMENVAENLKNEKIFDRILIVENYNDPVKGLRRAIVRGRELMVAAGNRKIIRRFVSGYEYDYYFTYGSNVESYFALDAVSSAKKPVLAFYEEGIGSYITDMTYALKPWHTALLKMTGTNVPALPDEFWVYAPELIKVDVPGSVAVKKIPYLSGELREPINRIWGYVPQADTDYSVVLFDQPLNDDTRQKEIFTGIADEDTVVKLHPRTPDRDKYKGVRPFPQQDCLWEISLLNNPGMGDCVLVSEFSTACFTPKCMFGMEPVAVFLVGMFSDYPEKSRNLFFSLISSLREIYTHRDRVHVVDSVGELKAIMADAKRSGR